LRGFGVGYIETAGKSDEAKENRLKCCQLLLDKEVSPLKGEPAWTHQQFGDAKMTALHWAAYHNDS